LHTPPPVSRQFANNLKPSLPPCTGHGTWFGAFLTASSNSGIDAKTSAQFTYPYFLLIFISFLLKEKQKNLVSHHTFSETVPAYLMIHDHDHHTATHAIL
jgi:hypothetical protein